MEIILREEEFDILTYSIKVVAISIGTYIFSQKRLPSIDKNELVREH